MEWFPCVLVLWTSICLVVDSHGSPMDNLCVLYIRKNMSVKIKPTGSLRAAVGSPNLFSLLKVKPVRDKKLTNPTVSIESAATGKFICMDQFGTVYLADRQKLKQKDEGRKRRNRRTRGGRRFGLPRDCHFRQVKVPRSPSMYQELEGIYSAHYSNSTVGRFLAFNKAGFARSVRHRFDKLGERSHRILVTMQNTSSWQYEMILDKTIFGSNRDRNDYLRECIRQRFNPNKSVAFSNLEKVRHLSLRRVISICKEKYRKEHEEAESERMNIVSVGGRKNRRKIKQDSRQRSRKKKLSR